MIFSNGYPAMKIAVSGKGGVGKSTVAAALGMLFSRRGYTVLMVDADPDANLAAALGIPAVRRSEIVTIARESALIEERTGARPGDFGAMFRLNPEVSDIAGRFAFHWDRLSLLVLGAIERGGSGCACAASSLVRSLVQELVLRRDEVLVMDMEAGIEHLGRATARGVDLLLIVSEPGQRSADSALRIESMARQIGITRIAAVANRVRSAADRQFLEQSLPGLDIIGWIPFSERLCSLDRDGISVLDGLDDHETGVFSSLADRILPQKSS
jgi:CO dehydrogenase maturation factor